MPVLDINADRKPTVWQPSEVHRESDPKFTGNALPNAGDMVIDPDTPNNYLYVTALDVRGRTWVFERRHGDPDKAMEDYRQVMEFNSGRKDRRRVGGGEPHLVDDGQGNLVTQYEQGAEEPGVRARAKLAARSAARKTAKVFRWTVSLVISLVIICAAVIATYAYKSTVTARGGYERTCRAVLSQPGNKDPYELTGRRTYSYIYRSVLGYTFIDSKQMSEKTILDVKGDAMTIVGQYVRQKPVDPETNEVPPVEERWWGINVGMGERGTQQLKGADNYTFIVDTGKGGRKLGVIKYDEFCKG